jgi:hypothetical protein
VEVAVLIVLPAFFERHRNVMVAFLILENLRELEEVS